MSERDVQTMPLDELIGLALDTADRSEFWLLVGVICARLSTSLLDGIAAELWKAGHTEPADYDGAVATLRQLRKARGEE